MRSKATLRIAGPKWAPCHEVQRSTSARSRGVVGARSARPALAAMYASMAVDSHRTKSPSSRIGTLPLGFFASIAGVRASPLKMSTVASSRGMPTSWARATTFWQFGENGNW